MKITKIELTNFRNYSKFKLENLQNLNIIIGNNGVGKTSILESIYLCSLARSFKGNDDAVIIKSNELFSKVKVELLTNGNIKKLEYILTKDGKKTKINNTLKKRISEFISQYKIVLFSPDEIKIIKDAPSTRRTYLNISLSQINRNYIKLINDYNVLIKNKNDYLKKMFINSNIDETFLDILDIKIAQVGKKICEERYEYLEKLNKNIKRIFRKFKPNDEIIIKYESNFLDKNETEIIKYLKKNRLNEMNIGMTKIGIHRDDFVFIHNGLNAKEYSSQGTQKLILLCLKLAELNILINDYYEEPILLLDDLFSELDIINQNLILNNLNKNVQIFITTTDLNSINKKIVKKAKIINLEGGN